VSGDKTGPMTIRIMDDGSVRISTDKVSPAAHVRAERFLGEVARILDGTRIQHSKHDGHHHHGEHAADHHHDKA